MDHHESKLSSSSTDNIRFYILALTSLRWNGDTYQLPARVAKGPRILAWNGGTAARLCPILQLRSCLLLISCGQPCGVEDHSVELPACWTPNCRCRACQTYYFRGWCWCGHGSDSAVGQTSALRRATSQLVQFSHSFG